MQIMLRTLVYLSAVFWPEWNLLAVSYVDAKPLSKVVTDGVTGCGSMAEVQVPVITWGGDIATILANGNSLTTQGGSLFADQGIKVKLVREDVFSKQVSGYLKCRSPYLRGTMGMVNMAREVTDKDAKSKLKVIYQLTWSAGGDALVVKDSIKRPKDLRGKTIVLQAYGPHVDYLGKILADAGVKLSEVKLKWVKDLTGTDESPMKAFYEKGVDAALVIIPDALALTSNGTVGTGSEDSVRGAKILLSTKSANRIIADVYAVRSDYFQKNREKVGKFVHGLMLAEEKLKNLVSQKSSMKAEYGKTFKASAKILLDAEQAVPDAEGLYADAQFVGWGGNKKFFEDQNYPRGFKILNSEIQESLKEIKMVSASGDIGQASWDYKGMRKGIISTGLVETGKFNSAQVANVVRKRSSQGNLGDDSLFSFEVFFKPNQNAFSADQYAGDFKKVINLASTYGGAIITVEGHSDPLGYLKKKKKGASNVVLQKVRQSAKNLSLTRANAVRDALVEYAKKKGITVDPTQFAVVGHGIAKPRSGLCGVDPCAPSTKQQWLDNMRVEFKIIQVEAEEDVFSPI